tara:strand:- start:12033 stop:12935 length:903 start_codon:yes stop_codon:yes gene_type:complete
MKVLIVGLGSIAKKHCKALLSIDSRVKIFALRSNNNAEVFQNVINVYSFSDLLNINFDFIIISSPTFLHEKHISEMIQLNKPLFIEKPLSNSIKIKKLINFLQTKQIKTYVACNLRFLDALIYAKRVYKNSKINEINAYCGSFLPDWRPDQDFKKGYSANPKMGGGVHLDLIHELDYLYWFFGKPNKVTKFLKSNSTLKIDSIDYANYILEYKNFVASVVLNYFRKDAKRTLEIITESKTILIDLIENKVYENGIIVFESLQKPMDTYESQLRYFTESINMNNKNFNDIREAFEVLKICI